MGKIAFLKDELTSSYMLKTRSKVFHIGPTVTVFIVKLGLRKY